MDGVGSDGPMVELMERERVVEQWLVGGYDRLCVRVRACMHVCAHA